MSRDQKGTDRPEAALKSHAQDRKIMLHGTAHGRPSSREHDRPGNQSSVWQNNNQHSAGSRVCLLGFCAGHLVYRVTLEIAKHRMALEVSVHTIETCTVLELKNEWLSAGGSAGVGSSEGSQGLATGHEKLEEGGGGIMKAGTALHFFLKLGQLLCQGDHATGRQLQDGLPVWRIPLRHAEQRQGRSLLEGPAQAGRVQQQDPPAA